jgi:hypothetical protein
MTGAGIDLAAITLGRLQRAARRRNFHLRHESTRRRYESASLLCRRSKMMYAPGV